MREHANLEYTCLCGSLCLCLCVCLSLVDKYKSTTTSALADVSPQPANNKSYERVTKWSKRDTM